MDMESLSLFAPLQWVSDRLRLADIKPRHIGRVVTFDYVIEPEIRSFADKAVLDDTEQVIGTLEGAAGYDITVSGNTYNYDDMIDLRVWRREVRK